MNRRVTIAIALVLLIAAAGLQGFWSTSSADDPSRARPSPASLEGRILPDLTLTTLDGRTVSLTEYRHGKVVLLSFFATWCTFCSAEVDTLNKIHKQYRGKPLKILAVDMQESPSLVQQYISRKGITYLVFLDRDMSAARILNVLGVPTNLIIDRDGIVRYHSNPLPDNYREIIDPLLQGLDKRAPGA